MLVWHLTRHIKNPTLSGKYMQRHILHVISKIPPSLASTCKDTSYTSYQNPILSGKYMQRHILHVISKIPPSLASTCKCHILHVISKSHPLWQLHASVTSYTSYQNPTLSGKYMQVSHLTRHIKIPPSLASICNCHILHVISEIPPSLASTCKDTSYTSYQDPSLSRKYMPSHIFHVISRIPPSLASTCKCHILHVISKIPPSLASTCKCHILHVISKIPPSLASTCKFHIICSLWQPPPSRQMTWGRTEEKYETTSWSDPPIDGRSVVHEAWFPTFGGWIVVYESWFTMHSLRVMVYQA